MGKNKRTAKAAWRAAARAAPPLPTITNTGHLLVATVASADTLGINAANEPAPAPTQQPRNVHAQNACRQPRTSSFAPHTASASSNAARTSHSHPQPPFAIAHEPEAPPATTQRETRNVHRANAHSTPQPTFPASQTTIANAQDVPTPPQRTIRMRATENESEKGSGSREDEVCTARDVHGRDPRPVRTPTPPASRTRVMTVRDMPAPCNNPATPFASECEPTPRPVPTTPFSASHMTTHDPHDVPASPTAAISQRAATNESDDRREARGDDKHDPHNASSASLPTTSPTPSASPSAGSSSARHDTIPPTTGLEPRGPQEAAAHLNTPPRPTSIFADADPAIFDPAYLEEVVAAALRQGHAAGLKEGRNVGFREGLEAGKRTGRAEGREEGLQEGIKASQDGCVASPILHPPFATAPHISSIDAIDDRLLREIRFTAYNSGFEDGFALSDKDLESAQSIGYAKGCEEEARRLQVQKPEQADAQTETTMPSAVLLVDAQTQTSSLSTHDPAPASFSWADEADSLPVHLVSPLPTPRDFSALRSSSRSPFGSLQRRARRSHRADLRPPRPTFLSAPVITRRHPAGLRAGRPSITHVSSLPSGFAVLPSPLSWDGDPRLVELSRVLQSLGWVHESSG